MSAQAALSVSRILSVDEVLARIDNLPTLSQVSFRVGEMISDPRVGPREIADAMRSDPSLSAKVLRLVNSSYYGIPGGVSDVVRAISFIGFNTLHQLVLSVAVMGSMRSATGSLFDLKGLWLHALAVGVCAETLARRTGHKDPGACFTAGLLHDVGKIALANAEGERYMSAFEAAKSGGLSMSQAEREAGLPTHDLVGSRLARRWKFPPLLLVPIEMHHGIDSERIRNELALPLVNISDIVSIADAICRMYNIGNGGSAPPDPRLIPLNRLGLSHIHLEQIHSDLMRRLELSKVFLELVG